MVCLVNFARFVCRPFQSIWTTCCRRFAGRRNGELERASEMETLFCEKRIRFLPRAMQATRDLCGQLEWWRVLQVAKERQFRLAAPKLAPPLGGVEGGPRESSASRKGRARWIEIVFVLLECVLLGGGRRATQRERDEWKEPAPVEQWDI